MLFVSWLLLFFADPAQAKSLLQKGLLALQHGQFAEARTTLQQASQADPKNAYVWTALAETYLRTGNLAEAKSAAEKAGQIGGGNPVVVHALGLFSFHYAQLMLRQQNFTEAADVLSKAMQTDKNNAQLTLALGVARYGQRRFDEAIGSFLEVISIDPSIEQPYIFLGKMLDQAGSRLPAIEKDCETWASKEPQNPKSSLVLAKVLLQSDPGSERAGKLLRRSIQLDPNEWESHYELGLLLTHQHDYKTAAAEFTRSIELDGRQAMPHYHLARVYDRLGEPDRAAAERKIHRQLTEAGAPH